MNPKLRIPLAALAGALAVAAFWAVKPSESPSGSSGVAQAAEASADPGLLAPFLRFSGMDSVKVKPDQAELQATATATAGSSKAALDEAGAKLQRVTDRMRALGIADDDLSTDPVNTYQDWESKDWTANVTLRVRIDDVDRAGEILAEANAAGADAVSGPYFSLESQDAAYTEAMKKAIENARTKAEAAATQMGVTVTGVVSVDETPGAGQPPVMMAADVDAAGGAMEESARAVAVQAGDQEIFASVTVTFTYAAAG